MLNLPAVFTPTGSFNITGMTAADGQDISVTFRLTKDGTCPSSTDPALQPQVLLLRRNCDGSVPKSGARAATAPEQLRSTTAVCTAGVYEATVTAAFVHGDKSVGILIRLADGARKLAIVALAA
jgi:hypothetical protein